MEQSEIQRKNEAIAKYMGARMYDHGDGTWQLVFPSNGGVWPQELSYHKDWGLLMPVVEKIMESRKEGWHIIPAYKGGYICRFGTGSSNDPKGDTPIHTTWLAVSDLILSLEK